MSFRMIKFFIATVLVGITLAAPKINPKSINFRPQVLAQEERTDDSNILMEFIQSAISNGAVEAFPEVGGEDSCRIHRAMIDFRKVTHGNNFILSPLKIDLGFCSGSCHNTQNMTAYDFLANSFAPSVPSKKCMVSKFGDLSFLYVDEMGNLRSQILRHSVAVECACAR